MHKTKSDLTLQNIIDQFQIKNIGLLQQAHALAELTGSDALTPHGQNCAAQGLEMAEILAELKLDNETLAASMVYSTVRYADLSIDDVSEQLGARVSKLVEGTTGMDALNHFHERISKQSQLSSIDNLRKMLLAMVDDVRIVLIKLAERLCILRNPILLNDLEKEQLAKETMDIYAPLANRLGVGHLKWILEDLAFRYLNPVMYKKISTALKSKRHEREKYVNKIINHLDEYIKKLAIEKFEVSGRAKHIYSIYRKMIRKNVDVDQIFDITAFRILLPTITDCYSVLGYVHSAWEHIPKEFDDYIAQPKPNGYRSIHTAVIDSDGMQFEIQIRTFDMHNESELGVAAHWAYKENKQNKTDYEAKIAWLRQVMDWQKEVTEDDQKSKQIYSNIFADRVYVFTPNGDVMDLPAGATPLDFAYHIHSEIGHRCRGAKINNMMVPLTYALQTGERVEILTSKEGNPSRDWLNPHLGYLKTARAKAKVLSWFRKQEHDKQLAENQPLSEKDPPSEEIQESLPLQEEIFSTKHKTQNTTDIEVEGVNNLLTHIALCCKPIPGDLIVGYVTLGHGVSIHRNDCHNILNISETQKKRIICVNWGAKTQQKYAVDLIVHAYDRPGLVRDITTLLANENLSILRLNCTTSKKDHSAHIILTIEIQSLNPLDRILTQVQQLPHIFEVKRQT